MSSDKLHALFGNAAPDLSRAVRAMVAFMAPLLLAMTGWVPWDMSFVAIAAQNIAMVDVRGDYRLRLGLVLAMAAVFMGAAALGASVAENITVAVLATGFVAVCGGAWRHLSTDYGPSLAISSTLVFFIALATPGAGAHVGAHALAALAGGLWGVLVQVAAWPFRPQHPLRRAVAESWLSVADLAEAVAAWVMEKTPAQHDRVIEAESAARTMLDHTYATLEAMTAGALRTRLEELHLVGARIATRVTALHTALEPVSNAPAFTELAPVFEQVLTSLANLSRNAAVTVVSRQPAHLAAFEVRTRRVASLLGVLRARLGREPAHAQLAEIARQIEAILQEAHDTLRATVERHDERAAFSFELLDLRTLALRPLASALNLSLHIEAALVRFTLRLAALTMLGVLVFKHANLPHGYWLPFTVVVVLQPDYGSTRARAGQRALGTLAGSIVASALLALRLPLPAIMGATAATVFVFGFFVKRNYAIAIFFVTLFIVILTEATHPVTIAFTIERLASTLAGGALALLAAFIFWPVWERDRLPPILARTFRANRDYLRILAARLFEGGSFDRDVIKAKRGAEGANNAAFSSLRRMSGDPKNQQDGIEHAATLVNGNQRLTRALNVLALHLAPGAALRRPGLASFVQRAEAALEELARAAEGATPAPDHLEPLLAALEENRFPHEPATERERWVFAQLTRAATELSALLLAVQTAAPPWQGERVG